MLIYCNFCFKLLTLFKRYRALQNSSAEKRSTKVRKKSNVKPVKDQHLFFPMADPELLLNQLKLSKRDYFFRTKSNIQANIRINLNNFLNLGAYLLCPPFQQIFFTKQHQKFKKINMLKILNKFIKYIGTLARLIQKTK